MPSQSGWAFVRLPSICQEFSFNSQSFLMGFGVFWRLKSTSAKSNTISDCFPNWVPHMFISPPHHTTQPSSPNQYLWCLVDPPSVQTHLISSQTRSRQIRSPEMRNLHHVCNDILERGSSLQLFKENQCRFRNEDVMK